MKAKLLRKFRLRANSDYTIKTVNDGFRFHRTYIMCMNKACYLIGENGRVENTRVVHSAFVREHILNQIHCYKNKSKFCIEITN